ncbi:anti-sigma factor [Nocardia brasiliensis]|uniref:Anti-sigma factor n=1 Tax=Nocardia brasiliensis TaxID=37326 RepID=A0A6G9XP14_NOCBR|nr:anti-sigma factor [Nocardia brasiliensis]QIS02644.1 anti-sigma factor [Nocardia brasiliensis]
MKVASEQATPWHTAVLTHRVSLELAADLHELGMLRALTDTVCMMADITLDAIPDIRLVVSEAATAMMLDAVPGTTLRCEFDYTRRRFTARIAATATRDAEDRRDPLSWQLVQLLTDSAESSRGPFDPVAGGYPTVIEFSWERGTSDGT